MTDSSLYSRHRMIKQLAYVVDVLHSADDLRHLSLCRFERSSFSRDNRQKSAKHRNHKLRDRWLCQMLWIVSRIIFKKLILHTLERRRWIWHKLLTWIEEVVNSLRCATRNCEREIWWFTVAPRLITIFCKALMLWRAPGWCRRPESQQRGRVAVEWILYYWR